jgi:membrane protease YdiL (CAAX protease family)
MILAIASIAFAAVVVILMPLRAALRWRRRIPISCHKRVIAENVLLTAALCALMTMAGYRPSDWGFFVGNWTSLLLWTFTCTGVVVGIDMLGVLATRRRTTTVTASAAMDSLNVRAPGHSFVVLCLTSSVWEELCFRAVPVALLASTAYERVSIVLASSVLFGAHHLRRGPTAAAYAVWFGLLFSILYWVSGSAYPVIISHASGNLFTAYFGVNVLIRGVRRESVDPLTTPTVF